MIFNSTRFSNSILSLGLAIILALTSISVGFAQNDESYIRRVPSMESDKTGPLNPVGLSFSSRSKNFYVVEDQGQGLAPTVNSDVIAITPFAERRGSDRIAAIIEDPLNMVFDSQNSRLLAFMPSTAQLLEVRENPSGNLDRTIVIRHNARRFGIQDPQGLTLDEESGGLFILDGVGPRIIRVQLGPGRNFTGGRITEIDLNASGLVAPRGIAFNPETDHLYVFDMINQNLYELTLSGAVVSTRNLVRFGLKSPQAMIFAPSGDQTDDPSQMSLFLADSGLITGRGGGARLPGSSRAPVEPSVAAHNSSKVLTKPIAPAQNTDQVLSEPSAATQSTGQILELSLDQPAAPAASSFTTSLIKTTDQSTISPPSPDPSGLAYLPLSNSLIMDDGEVEETVSGITHFQGANVWELTLGGDVIRTANISDVPPTVVPMTNEPTGVAWNPNNGHYYFSDDNSGIDVYDLDPGPDGLVGTSDDSWSGFDTSFAGNGDAEGVAYDSWNNRIFVADGVNAEVYEYTLAGALINHFDVQGYGVLDPESVEFNPDSGTLFVMSSSSSSPVIVETTTTGVLLQTIDISVTNAHAAAGLAYAPASNGSGTKRFYIVDRGVDNNSNPDIIDGKMFELSAPSSGPTPTPSQTLPPSATFTATSTFTPGPSPTNTPITDLIFTDGFESGGFSAWTSISGSALSVTTQAALVGNYGMQANLNGSSSYLLFDLPSPEAHYRARFYFDPNSISMADGDRHYIFVGYDSASVFNLDFQFSGGNYQIRLRQHNNSQSTQSTNWAIISDAPHYIEIEWIAATGAGANDGGVTLWVDGLQQGFLSGLDNDTRRIENVRFGAAAGVDASTVGIYYMDAFESRQESYIGPEDPPLPTATNTLLPTATNTPLPTATDTPLPTATPTNTPLPTATNTPLPTATNTPLPTATNTPLPTATNTPLPTATNTPLPTATNTPLPTATNTPLPTATNTPLPTTTNTPLPTATNTPLPTATNTPLPTATNTPLPTATNTPLPTATNTPLPTTTNTPLPTATNTPLPTATNTPLPTATNTPLPTATPTNTPLPTATNTPLPTATNTPLPTATNTPLPTATNTPLPTATNTPQPTATDTPLPTVTNTPLPTATNTPLPTATNTLLPTATNTPTPLPTATSTPLPTATNTPLPTATSTPLPTATDTPLPTATNTPLPTATPTNTPLPTATNTPLPTATNTPLPTATSTPLPTATNTPLPTPTNTPLPTATNTPLPTATDTPLPTATNTPLPTATSTPLPTATNTPLPTPTATATPLPTPAFTPTPTNTPVSSVITLAPVADSRVMQVSPDTNDGTLSRLDVDSPGEESYIRFSVSGVTGTVQSATLRLFVTNGSSNGPSIYGTDNTWTETGITWNNRPAPTTGVIANVDAMSTRTWTEYDLTGYVTGNGTYSFVFLPDSSNGVRFYSREGSSPPQLVLTFTSGTVPAPTNTPLPTATPTFTPTNTALFTATPTSTPTMGPSPTPSNTLTTTSTPSVTSTPANTPTPTNTPISSVITFAPVADSRVMQVSPDTNDGTLGRLDVDSPGEESYIRFSVSGVTGTVQNATLRLFVTNGSSNGPSIYGTDNTWTETGITWNNRPSPTTGALANVDAMTAGIWTEYDLSDYVTGDGTYNFVFQPDSSNGVRFDSRENSSPPELVLTLLP